MTKFTALRNLLKENPNWRTVFLVVCGVIYLLVGALLFTAVESKNEFLVKEKLDSEEKEFKLKYNVTEADYLAITRTILEIEPHKSGIQWGFSGAIYFAITVVTTIGYGHSVPRTIWGKIICIFYAVFGIPLWLITIQAMGERINSAAKNLLKKIFLKMGFKIDEVSHRALIPFGIFSCVITILIGTIAFAHFENWTYLNSAYYCVMTLSTIGFGDYVALQDGGTLQTWPQYVTFALTYIMIGLTVIGAFLNLVVLRMMVTLPDTPDVSVNSGSKRSSPDPNANISISCDSQFDDDIGSQHRRTSNISTNTRISHDRTFCCHWDNDCNSSQSNSKKYSSPHWSNIICNNCGEISSQKKEVSKNCSSCSYCDEDFRTTKIEMEKNISSVEANERDSNRSSFSLVNIFNTAISHTNEKATKEVPKVKVSHIELSFSGNSSKTNSDVNNLNQSPYNRSRYLSPYTAHFGRDRYGSGDSGYLGGAPTSASNVSRSTSEEESYSLCNIPTKSDSHTDHETNVQSGSFSAALDSYDGLNIQQNQTFDLIKDKHSFAKQKSLSISNFRNSMEVSEKKINAKFLPVFYQCDLKCNSDKKLLNKSQAMKKERELMSNCNQLHRQFSTTYHSDTELAYNRSDGVFQTLKDVVKPKQTSVYPMIKTEGQNDTETFTKNDTNIVELLASTRSRGPSSSLSRQCSNDTDISILNSGDLEEPSIFLQNQTLSTTQSNPEENKAYDKPCIMGSQSQSFLRSPVVCLEEFEKSKLKQDSLFLNKKNRFRSYSNPVSLLPFRNMSYHTPSAYNLKLNSCWNCLRVLNQYLNLSHKQNCLTECKFCLSKTFLRNYFELNNQSNKNNELGSDSFFHQKCLKFFCQSEHFSGVIELLRQHQIDCRSCSSTWPSPRNLSSTLNQKSSTSAETFLNSSATTSSVIKSSIVLQTRKENSAFLQELPL